MSFFGQNNQQSGGFGGFGSTNNATTGFGQPSNTGFGANSGASGGSLFGTSNTGFGAGGFGATASTSAPFGGNSSGFGSNTSTGGGLFGGNTATSGTSTGFGGFGGGTSNNTGSLFGGGNRPAFGAQQPSSNSGALFGGSNAFGSSNNQTTSAFGAPLSSALGNNNAECQGTGSTPFQAFTEKEGATGNQTNHFQSISFMQPYKNFSFEELRLADYNQGRRYGNGNGQAGAFGTSTGFGGFSGQNTGSGFGSNNQSGSLFGTQITSASPFGSNQTATSGFGSNTGGGAFGTGAAQKPGGLFGSTSSQPSGGLFGTANASGGFGAQNSSGTGFGTNQNGGLFGTNTQQQKPGFSFGQNNATAASNTGFGTSSTSGFGANNNNSAGGGLFGTNQTNAPFGSGQQQTSSNPFGGFGTNQQNQTNTASAFGGFGSNNQQQQKPGGLFGNNTNTTNTTSSLFGNNNQNQPSSTGSGLFGPASNNQTGGSSLFGPKPEATGTGLFGNNNNSSNTGNSGGGLFGTNNNQNQQNQGGGLFGNSNSQQQQKPGGLFGSATGGGLFGSSNNANTNQQGATSSLFGNSNPQQQSGGLFGSSNNQTPSLFNNTQQQQTGSNSLQPPRAYSASIFDANPYGNRSIFDGLPPPPQEYVGPVATPIGQKDKIKKNAVLPHYRINPHMASRFVTPPKRGGFGFTYSTYGTPSSVSSNMSTPGGLSSSLLQGSISRGLGKSLSTSNLRRSFDPEQESLLSPGAFSAGSTRFAGTGSLKKLTIDRSLRTDLFSSQSPLALPSPERNDQSRQPGILKKKVSFDASTVGGNGGHQNGTGPNGVNGFSGNDNGNRDTHGIAEQEPGTSSQPSNSVGAPDSDGIQSLPEMEQVKGNELTVINEDSNQEVLTAKTPSHTQHSQYDPKPGPYYMKPSREELDRMPKEQKKAVRDFCVGREGCGYVVFNAPVDLSNFPLDEIFGKIAQISLRSLTVYPDSARKPARGKGLNVPSTIYLANSWPRARDRTTPTFEKSGPRFQKHVERLRRVRDTEFVKYDKDTGTWIFKVKHFTTYGFDYEDEASELDSLQTSTLSAPPDTPTPKMRLQRAGATPMATGALDDSSVLSSSRSQISSDPEDTFEFRKKKLWPGAFDGITGFEQDEQEDHVMTEISGDRQSFLGERLAVSHPDNEAPSESQEIVMQDDSHSLDEAVEHLGMVGSFPQIDRGSEQENVVLKPILKPTQDAFGFGTPGKLKFNDKGDWATELQRTISPRKQDRKALRESQAYVMQPSDKDHYGKPKVAVRTGTGAPGFATSIDLMHSLFGQDQEHRVQQGNEKEKQGSGFKFAYPNTLEHEEVHLNIQNDRLWRDWHISQKPAWGPDTSLVYAIPINNKPSTSTARRAYIMERDQRKTIVSEGRDVGFAKMVHSHSLTPAALSLQRAHTRIILDHGMPCALPQVIPFGEIAANFGPKFHQEKSIWDLASILFDDLDSAAFGDIPVAERDRYEHRVRKDRLIKFWSTFCSSAAQEAVVAASNAEERAIAYLSANDVVQACHTLIEAKDFRLASLISQLPADQVMREDMANQIQEWRELCVLSEMTDEIRALYELCAGNVYICEGKKGPIEDQARTFLISQRFSLSWERAFGLRLWYATEPSEPIEASVRMFEHEIHNSEPKKPIPQCIQDESSLLWDDPDRSRREDLHWGLLKLFSASKDKDAQLPLPIASIVMPENAVGNPVDFRLSFQLFTTLAARFPTKIDQQKADQLTCDFANQLNSRGEWLWAMFVLLHISKHKQRQKALQDILARHAGVIPADESAMPFSHLITDLKIPSSWVWAAKALYARSVSRDHIQEIFFLQKANDWNEAHETLCHIVGPQCVIEQNHETLAQLLAGFKNGKNAIKTDEQNRSGWRYGGEVYQDYLALVKGGCEGIDEKPKVLKRMLGALPAMARDHPDGRKLGFEEGISIREMAGEVASAVARGDVKIDDASRVLQLPLASDQHLRHTVEFSLQYYKDVMARA